MHAIISGFTVLFDDSNNDIYTYRFKLEQREFPVFIGSRV